MEIFPGATLLVPTIIGIALFIWLGSKVKDKDSGDINWWERRDEDDKWTPEKYQAYVDFMNKRERERRDEDDKRDG